MFVIPLSLKTIEWLLIFALVLLFCRRSAARNLGRAAGSFTGGVGRPGNYAGAGTARRQETPRIEKQSLARYYRVLELKPTAAPEEIQQAYRELVKVWHPDRFPNDPRLREKATGKLQEINEAYEVLKQGGG